jgi:hypothetical protein
MRHRLAKEEGARKKFLATFSKIGKKVSYKGYSEDTILLTNIQDAVSGEKIADHVWFTYTKTFEKVHLMEGMVISFEARVRQYEKGYVNPKLGLKKRSVDFKLSHPTKIIVITK